MKLIAVSQEQILKMMTWFSSASEISDWAGPNFTYPFDSKSFTADLKVSEISSFSLLTDKDQLLGFGQYYSRLGKCHLGRLVIAPTVRGQGIAAQLILSLAEHGMKTLQVNCCSLFVLQHNHYAIRAYQKLGFTITNYPQQLPMLDCLYMVKIFTGQTYVNGD
jgi:ribosomal protein S18 acetylase RimI-like enzyme